MDFVTGEILYVDKPLHWSSFDVVKRLRCVIQKRTHLKRLKVGHAGTLDPLATGVMILCTGRATKKITSLQEQSKEYVATMALGAPTPSFDLETEIDATYPVDHITREMVEETLGRFTGKIEQTPPAFSACKVDGKRAYKSARKGHQVELSPKPLVIDEIELVDFSPGRLTIRVVCSKGTYIRALARDIGRALDSGAHLTALRRTRVGKIGIDQCMSLDKAVETIQNASVDLPGEEDPNPA